jgi:hypothetical protein
MLLVLDSLYSFPSELIFVKNSINIIILEKGAKTDIKIKLT